MTDLRNKLPRIGWLDELIIYAIIVLMVALILLSKPVNWVRARLR